ncbi:MAG TPA: carbonic anhydrase family protein [Polyangiales bacterium]
MLQATPPRSAVHPSPLVAVGALALGAALLSSCRGGGAATEAAPAASVSAAATSARPVEWGYTGERGPAHWAELSPVYSACVQNAQSPIDVLQSAETGSEWRADYRQTGLKIAHHEHVTDILDNGHTIQVTVDEGSTLTTARDSYALKQFHFHTPSEHAVDGKSFPMEVHFVHQSASGKFAVLSALFEEGAENANLATLIANFPQAKGETKVDPQVRLELALQLPQDTSAHSYLGSFTTPPCTEDVEWLILRKPVAASREQLDAFAARLNHNNRPLQPLHQRAIVQGNLRGSFKD